MTPDEIEARGERARKIAEAYQGRISERSSCNHVVTAEIPCMAGYPTMFAMSGLVPEFAGIETHIRPARPLSACEGTIACSTWTRAYSVPQNFAYYRIDLTATAAPPSYVGPSAIDITRQPG